MQLLALTWTADIGNENLRAQINTLQYELESLKQEREMNTLSHQAGLRDAQNKAEAEYQRAQVCEQSAFRQYTNR